MRVLVGCSSPIDADGGIASATRNFCDALISKGTEVIVACPPVVRERWWRERGIELVFTDPLRRQLDVCQELIEFVENRAIDAVLNNDNSALQSIAPVLSVPFTAVMHLASSAIGSLALHNLDYVDHVVAISNDMKRSVITRANISPERVPVVYNCIQIPHCERKRNRHSLKLLFAGGSDARKGADKALLTARTLSELSSSWQISWCKEVSPSIAVKLSRLSNVTYLGRISGQDMPNLLHATDVAILPSREEGCPMLLLESMSHGVIPIVSNCIGAMKDIVRDGVNGYVVSLKAWSEVVPGILKKLAQSNELREKLSEAARQDAIDIFSSAAAGARLKEIISMPRIARVPRPRSCNVVEWTRPMPEKGSKLSIVQRARFRLGILKNAGVVSRKGVDA